MAASLIATMAFSLIQPVASSLVNAITREGVRRTGKGQEGGSFPLLARTLMIKVLGEGVTRAGKLHNNMDHMDQNFQSHSTL